MERIEKMLHTLMKQSSMQNWGLQLEPAPTKIETTVLGAAEIFKDNQVVHINEQVLRRLPIQKAVNLTNQDWVVIF